MKGLFVKDLKLMMLQKNFLLLILAIVIGMMIFTDDVIFPLGFLSYIVSFFTVSTISYDDFDNGNAFLFTLPITRNHYVSEKYFLGLLLGCMAWVLATVLGIITTVLKDTLPITDLVQSSLMILPIMIVVQAIMLPFQLKFGGDKGRIAMIGAFGGLAVIGKIINELCTKSVIGNVSFNTVVIIPKTVAKTQAIHPNNRPRKYFSLT
jgi:hypothetical protein